MPTAIKQHRPARLAAAPGPARAPDHRPNAAARGYDHHWQRRREWFLRRHPVCEDCGRVAAQDVHHVLPLAEGGTHDEANLRALCRACHNRITRGAA